MQNISSPLVQDFKYPVIWLIGIGKIDCDFLFPKIGYPAMHMCNKGRGQTLKELEAQIFFFHAHSILALISKKLFKTGKYAKVSGKE